MIEHHVDPYVPPFMLITIYLLQYFRPELRAVGRGVRGDDQLPAVRHGQDAAVHHHLTCCLSGHLLPGRLRGVEVCRRSPAVPRRSNRPAGHQQSGNDKQILKMQRKRIIHNQLELKVHQLLYFKNGHQRVQYPVLLESIIIYEKCLIKFITDGEKNTLGQINYSFEF